MSKDLINWKLKRNTACGNVVFAINNAIKGHSIALMGNIYNMTATENDSNTIRFSLVNAAKRGVHVHIYVEQYVADAMRQNRIVNKIMNMQSVVIHIVRDWSKFNLGEEMKFDTIIMNPPFCSGLHLKVLSGVINHVDFKHDGTIVCIHPAAWLQFPSRIRPSFMDGLIESFDMINRKDANEMFGIEGGDLVVTTLGKDGDSFTGNAAEDKNFCCFKYNSQFTNTWKIVKSIYDKVITKYSQGNFDLQLNKITTSNYPLRICITHNTVKYPIGTGKTGGVIKLEDAFKITSKHYTTATKTTVAAGVKFLNFNTENERKNAWASYLTKFTRFCIAMDESTKLAPYMNDYTKPWDDKRFYEYFGLTDEEIDVIEKTIK